MSVCSVSRDNVRQMVIARAVDKGARRKVMLSFLLVFLPALSATTIKDEILLHKDVCETETFVSECHQDEVVLIRNALYGRMRMGRCAQVDMGRLGCNKSVLNEMEDLCSGNSKCELTIPNKEFAAAHPCLELKTYLEVAYTCLPVISAPRQVCESAYNVILREPQGYISSVITIETGCGTKQCPWVLKAPVEQTIQVTLLEFNFTKARHNPDKLGTQYGVIIDGPHEKIIYSQAQSKSIVYTSVNNEVQVILSEPEELTTMPRFLMKYEAMGCLDLKVPSYMWFHRKKDTAHIGCIGTTYEWKLTCDGTSWNGNENNCTADPASFQGDGMPSTGVLLVAVIVTLLTLTVVTVAVVIFLNSRDRKGGRHTSMSQEEADHEFLRPSGSGECEVQEKPAPAFQLPRRNEYQAWGVKRMAPPPPKPERLELESQRTALNGIA